jgi:hypothetical protein
MLGKGVLNPVTRFHLQIVTEPIGLLIRNAKLEILRETPLPPTNFALSYTSHHYDIWMTLNFETCRDKSHHKATTTKQFDQIFQNIFNLCKNSRISNPTKNSRIFNLSNKFKNFQTKFQRFSIGPKFQNFQSQSCKFKNAQSDQKIKNFLLADENTRRST